MAKKINSSGKCLALTTLWVNQFQSYGKFSFFSKTDFLLFFFLTKILIKQLNLNKKNFITKTQNFILSTQVFFIFSLVFINSEVFLKFYRFFIIIWRYNISSRLSFNLCFYIAKNQYFSTIFLKNYILYLINNNINSPKKIFNLLILLLKKNKFQSIVSFSKKGLKKNIFIGFKIQLKGRYEATKNGMSSRLLIKNGKINSTNLNITINFINHFFYTKLGITNLKIWLFYSTKF
uniref:Ribosomal protein S3 n=1 Tax=Symphyocladiella dendroidea TaxID=2506487 RepID=UPI0022FD888C|nr:Ribosomal protein S3 [Symphyocladiella dendroidea]WAX04018.1 Ribosomal protein S3 [Symphyocladiella dendroidea]